MRYQFLFIFILALLLKDLEAQVQVKIDSKANRSISNLPWEKTPVINVEVPNVKKLLLEDSIDSGRPFRFGKAVLHNINLADGIWSDVDSGRVWTLAIKSIGALSINLFFKKLTLGPDAKLYLASADQRMIMGPITKEFVSPSETFSTDVIAGDQILISLFEPKSELQKSGLHISKVVYGYKSLSNYVGFGDSAPCHNDIICPQGDGWQEEADAVALVIINNERACSGTLINNGCQDLTPNFLTAFHCLDNNPSDGALSNTETNAVSDWAFRFQYESPTCGGADDQNYFFFSGSQFRAAWVQTDFALLQLNNRPQANTGIRYAGWDRANVGPVSSVGIHHPRGDVMKISTENNPATSIAWMGGLPDSHWRVTFDDGTVEHGSSGSSLFDQNQRVVGQLHGNQNNTCQSTDNNNCFCTEPRVGEYGRFDVSWNGGGTLETQLSGWLTNDPNITQTNTIPIPSLTGPALICTSGTFTLNNAPATTISWSVSPSNLVSPSSGPGQLQMFL